MALAAVLVLAAVVGVAVFRRYGMTWDEPRFYAYAEAAARAYSRNAAGAVRGLPAPGGPLGDLPFYGPAYLLLGRIPVAAVSGVLRTPVDEAWHLINFVTFLLGVAAVFFLARRWVDFPAALAASILFLSQPLLWGHAFINPKDTPFLVFFCFAMLFGFRMVDRWVALTDASGTPPRSVRSRPPVSTPRPTAPPPSTAPGPWPLLRTTVLPGIILGLTCAIRIFGPFAGVLILAYGLSKRRPSFLVPAAGYAAVSILVMFVAWPYLWPSPVTRLIEVVTHTARNPAAVAVLFRGAVIASNALPRSYLPLMIGLTLTLPAVALFVGGLFGAGARLRRGTPPAFDLAVTVAWFVIPFGLAVLLRPSMYDGLRHVLFITPPIFVVGALAFQALFERLTLGWLRALLALAAAAPGLVAIVRLHPYEYAYYNEAVGGVAGAFRSYETDYWLSCYKEALQAAETATPGPKTVFVFVVPELAERYAARGTRVVQFDAADDRTEPGDWILMTTRGNADLLTHTGDPTVFRVGRQGATFCVMKEVAGAG